MGLDCHFETAEIYGSKFVEAAFFVAGCPVAPEILGLRNFAAPKISINLEGAKGGRKLGAS